MAHATRIAAPCLSTLLWLSGCGERSHPPLPPLTCAQINDPQAVRDHCLSSGGENLGEASCLPFAPPQRMSGLWIVGFETSEFFPGATARPSRAPRLSERTALSISNMFQTSPAAKQVEALAKGETHEIWVDMIARRSICTFSYGHAAFPNAVRVERFLKAREVRHYPYGAR